MANDQETKHLRQTGTRDKGHPPLFPHVITSHIATCISDKLASVSTKHASLLESALGDLTIWGWSNRTLFLNESGSQSGGRMYVSCS